MESISALRFFVQVAEAKSFSRAAERLGQPKSTVSTAIRALEASVGSRLLQRTTRTVELTHDGAIFFERCRDLLADFDELGDMFQQSGGEVSGRIRFAVPASRLARRLILPRLAAFMAAHPLIEVEMSATDRRIDLIREGFDCVLQMGPVADAGVVARKLPHVQVGSFASPAYLKKYGVPGSVGDLGAHRLIHYTGNLADRSAVFAYQDGDEMRAVPMQAAIVLDSTDTLAEACVAGLGILQTPWVSIVDELESGKLLQILPELRGPALQMSIVYPHRRHIARRLLLFIDWLEQLIGEEAPR